MSVVFMPRHAGTGVAAKSGCVRLAGLVAQSIVDGPGLRMAVFTQGCGHNCPGCHNPGTHDFTGGTDFAIEDIVARFDKNPLLAGITLSGGEPFARAGELVPLAEAVRFRGKSVWCYSGYTFEELRRMSATNPEVDELCRLVDVLADGPFLFARRSLELPFRGSANQRLLDMPASLSASAAMELRIEPW